MVCVHSVCIGRWLHVQTQLEIIHPMSATVATLYIGWARTIYLYVLYVYIRYSWQGNHHTYGHTVCIYVLANPLYIPLPEQVAHHCLSRWHTTA
jgi:hypothetical protein